MSKNSFSGTMQERAEWASRVRTLRIAAGHTQQELAVLAGVTRQTISNMESGEITPQTAVLARVLEVLGVDIDAPTFEGQTELWLSMLGSLIEAVSEDRRPAAVNAAAATLASHVRADAPTTDVGGLSEDDLRRNYDTAAGRDPGADEDESDT